jgi:hypothetical protein
MGILNLSPTPGDKSEYQAFKEIQDFKSSQYSELSVG